METDLEAQIPKVLTSAAACRKTLMEEEAKLRELVLAAYADTGNKKPAHGVGIRIVKELEYDESKALDWAVASGADACLSLQKSNFKKVADGLKLDFVAIKEVPQATISKEL